MRDRCAPCTASPALTPRELAVGPVVLLRLVMQVALALATLAVPVWVPSGSAPAIAPTKLLKRGSWA